LRGATKPQPHCTKKRDMKAVVLDLCWWYSKDSCCYDSTHPVYSELPVIEAYEAWVEQCETAGCSESCKSVVKKFYCQTCSPEGLFKLQWCKSFCLEVMKACSGTFEVWSDMEYRCEFSPIYDCFNGAQSLKFSTPRIMTWWLIVWIVVNWIRHRWISPRSADLQFESNEISNES